VTIETVDALDLPLTEGAWDFAVERADDIAAHWRRRHAEQPSLFNGRVLMLRRYTVDPAPTVIASEAKQSSPAVIEGPADLQRKPGSPRFARDDGAPPAPPAPRTLRGEFIETDFAAFLAWREFGFPASNALNGFSMAALRSADGAFLLGEMSPHTASAGAIYFPAGTPDPHDVYDGRVDLEASARRELTEETGLAASEAEISPVWHIVRSPGRVACMKPMRLRVDAQEARAKIEAWIAKETRPEFGRIHVVRGEKDFTPAMSGFVRDYVRWVWSGEREGEERK
jgi:8-oxo-dGTP pyrophosphatase MutT (NUDIX family)